MNRACDWTLAQGLCHLRQLKRDCAERRRLSPAQVEHITRSAVEACGLSALEGAIPHRRIPVLIQLAALEWLLEEWEAGQLIGS
ncbi:MAG: hypothetical protein ACO1RX_08405 [Candidatus Sericytochromatia bacterium]